MVDAVLKDLPEEWNVVVVMDWSDGFWDKMKKSIIIQACAQIASR